ncbi:TolC family outer membrane protein [Chelativorans sp. AA-79]|uniref:TolC family outer membrane protein n=1 Tax=Chelativorans sp. AA-79 TaxID=3028735 RepID=UPI0023F872E4|nr:TolC family outer membrane protein [Chelativorans sp. AA-79]WEX07227.1 TolC family outer membrane protein [Chelativorans sp. AA-79]
MTFLRSRVLAVLAAGSVILSPLPASAETILGALAKAYQNNSSLNSSRAGVRVTDENVAIAKSGMRPRITGNASAQVQRRETTDVSTGQFGITLEQPIFDGFQTHNNVRASEAQVLAANAALRNDELNLLFDAAQTYMQVIRDRQIAALRAENLQFLEEQVRSARSRLEVGEGTRTDVAQSQAQRQLALAQLSAARAQAAASAARYRQIVGDEPGTLQAPDPLTTLLPASLDQATAIALSEHPAIAARQHWVDVYSYQVKVAEGTLLPNLSASASLTSTRTESSPSALTDGTQNSASIGLNLRIPIYQGGEASARVRQSKETLGQARIDVDVTRDEVLQAITSAWTQYQAARETVAANREQVNAAQLALSGVIEERDVGQRTTLNVLDAQADVIDARIDLVTAQYNVVVASYAIAQAMGRLSPSRLGLNVAIYDPQEHYRAVKDKWYGLRTPDGR